MKFSEFPFKNTTNYSMCSLSKTRQTRNVRVSDSMKINFTQTPKNGTIIKTKLMDFINLIRYYALVSNSKYSQQFLQNFFRYRHHNNLFGICWSCIEFSWHTAQKRWCNIKVFALSLIHKWESARSICYGREWAKK